MADDTVNISTVPTVDKSNYAQPGARALLEISNKYTNYYEPLILDTSKRNNNSAKLLHNSK